jgi:hypothetical protein
MTPLLNLPTNDRSGFTTVVGTGTSMLSMLILVAFFGVQMMA